MLVNHTNLHYRHKIFQVAHESRDCIKSIWIFFQFCFIFTEEEKKGHVTICGNGSYISMITALQAVHLTRNKSKDGFI